MLFQEAFPQKRFYFFGGVSRIPTYLEIPNKGLQAYKLAMLSNIGVVSEDLHTYIVVV